MEANLRQSGRCQVSLEGAAPRDPAGEAGEVDDRRPAELPTAITSSSVPARSRPALESIPAPEVPTRGLPVLASASANACTAAN